MVGYIYFFDLFFIPLQHFCSFNLFSIRRGTIVTPPAVSGGNIAAEYPLTFLSIFVPFSRGCASLFSSRAQSRSGAVACQVDAETCYLIKKLCEVKKEYKLGGGYYKDQVPNLKIQPRASEKSADSPAELNLDQRKNSQGSIEQSITMHPSCINTVFSDARNQRV